MLFIHLASAGWLKRRKVAWPRQMVHPGERGGSAPGWGGHGWNPGHCPPSPQPGASRTAGATHRAGLAALQCRRQLQTRQLLSAVGKCCFLAQTRSLRREGCRFAIREECRDGSQAAPAPGNSSRGCRWSLLSAGGSDAACRSLHGCTLGDRQGSRAEWHREGSSPTESCIHCSATTWMQLNVQQRKVLPAPALQGL